VTGAAGAAGAADAPGDEVPAASGRAEAAPARPGVAAFDFDGTLARHDTLVPFLRHVCGTPRVLVAAARAALRSRDRDHLKVAAIGHLFRGRSAADVDELGRAYVPTIADLLRPEMLDRLRWHRAQGHAVLIVSASLGVYLRPLAAHLGLDAALAVELVADVDGVLTGAVVGELNTRGPEKVARLRRWTDDRFGADAPFELWAYGDSAGDEELLELADHPTWVGRRAGRAAGG
jgi:phosphatidylglycerophosphatase C